MTAVKFSQDVFTGTAERKTEFSQHSGPGQGLCHRLGMQSLNPGPAQSWELPKAPSKLIAEKVKTKKPEPHPWLCLSPGKGLVMGRAGDGRHRSGTEAGLSSWVVFCLGY